MAPNQPLIYRECLASLEPELASLRAMNARLAPRDVKKYGEIARTCGGCGHVFDWAHVLSGGKIVAVGDGDFDTRLLFAPHEPLVCACGRTMPVDVPMRRGASELGDERRLLYAQAEAKVQALFRLSAEESRVLMRFIFRYTLLSGLSLCPRRVASDAVIALSDVRKSYRLGSVQVEALRGIDLTLHRGEFTAVVGASGAGKSTLLNIIGCIDRATSGSVRIDGVDVAPLSENQRADLRNRHIGFVFQSFNLLPVLNIFENVELPLLAQRDLSAKERRQRVLQVVEDVELTAVLKQRPDQLSGGQRQRVAVARALVTQPSIIIADEPTANLDSHTAHRVLNLMVEMNEMRGVTFVISTHDERIMQRVGRFVRISDGVIAAE